MSVLGKKIADLKGNVTGLNFSPEKNTATVEETDVGLFGTVIMTVTFWPPVDPDKKTGQYSEFGYTMRPDGTSLSFTMNGVWTEKDQGVWKVQGIALAEDGPKVFVDMEYEFATKSRKGELFELG